jgi:hypothetical protein
MVNALQNATASNQDTLLTGKALTAKDHFPTSVKLGFAPIT